MQVTSKLIKKENADAGMSYKRLLLVSIDTFFTSQPRLRFHYVAQRRGLLLKPHTGTISMTVSKPQSLTTLRILPGCGGSSTFSSDLAARKGLDAEKAAHVGYI
jgi:hypothetical protein